MYAITGQETLCEDLQERKGAKSTPEMEVLGRLMLFFGPLPEGLVKHTSDKKWEKLLAELSEMMASVDPSAHFEQWGENDFPNLIPEGKRMLSRMLNPDPAERATVSEVLEGP